MKYNKGNKNIVVKPDLSKLFKSFENKWVVLSPNYKEIISSGDSLEEVASKVKQNEREKVIFHRVIPIGFSPNAI